MSNNQPISKLLFPYFRKILYIFIFIIIFITSVFFLDRIIYKYRLFFIANKNPQEQPPPTIPTDIFNSEKYDSLIKLNDRYGRVGEKNGKILDNKKKYDNGATYANSVLLSNTGAPIFDVHYSFDKYGRRLLSPTSPIIDEKDSIGIIVLGCSFIFGTGVNDNETLPYYVSELTGKKNVVNLGIGGAGPNDFLADLESKKERYKFPFKKIILVYGFIPSHIQRTNCNTSCYFSNKYMLGKPHYIINSEEKLENLGPHANFYQNEFLKNTIGNLYNFSEPNGLFVFPNDLEPEGINLYAEILKQIKIEFSKQYEVLDFYHLDLSFNANYKLMNLISSQKQLSDFKIINVPSEELKLKFSVKNLRIPIDWHPTPLAHYLYAQALAYQIIKDHPELFKK